MSKVTIKLAALLSEAKPEYDFDPKDIKRNYDGGTQATEGPLWVAAGKNYTSFLNYEYVWFDGWDTMTICARNGIVVTDKGYKRFDVNPK